MIGLSLRASMTGTYWRLDAPVDERGLRLRFVARSRDIGRFFRQGAWVLAGTIDADGLASAQALEGTVGFGRLEERRLPYRFEFAGDDGRRYALTGEQEWSGLAPVESLARLPATLSDPRGEEIGRALLRIDRPTGLADWVSRVRVELS